jgi:aspartate/methionine/tyrosine aminotransferase
MTGSVFSGAGERLTRVEDLQRQANRLLRAECLSHDVFSDVVNPGVGNVLLIQVSPEYFRGDCHELFLALVNGIGLGILPGNAFGFPVEKGNAWFRMTTIHDHPGRIAEDLTRLASAVRNYRL